METLYHGFRDRLRFEADAEWIETFGAIPAVPNGIPTDALDCAGNCYEFCYYDVFKRDLRLYCDLLAEQGFEPVESREWHGNQFLFFRKGELFLSLAYTEYNQALKVIAERNQNTRNYPLTRQEPTGVECPVILTQIGLEYAADGTPSNGSARTYDEGFSYCVRLRDGRFLVIDGGDEFEPHADLLWSVLERQNLLPGKPVIAGWFFTHAHPDHAGVYAAFLKKYAGEVTIERILHNVAISKDPCMTDRNGYHDRFLQVLAGDETPQIKLHPGMVFDFGNVSVDVLYTFELFMPRKSINYNLYSIILKLRIGENDVLFLSDFGVDSLFGDHLPEKMYGQDLRANVVQVAHHGYGGGGSAALYRLIDPEIALWPVSRYRYQLNHLADQERNAPFLGMENVFVAGCTFVTLEWLPDSLAVSVFEDRNAFLAASPCVSRNLTLRRRA